MLRSALGWGGGQVVAAVGGPVAQMLSQSADQAGAQGQRVGRWSTSRRPVDARRAGTLMMRRRRVAQRAVAIPAAIEAALMPLTENPQGCSSNFPTW